jgi:hypothetical protein
MSDEAREEGFYWVILGQNPPEIAYWERGEWWLAGDARPWPIQRGVCRQRAAGIQAAAHAGGVVVNHSVAASDVPPSSGPVVFGIQGSAAHSALKPVGG